MNHDPDRLRDTLHDLSTDAPTPAPDLAARAWGSGRTTRRREVWAVVAAALLVVALASTLVWNLRSSDAVAPVDSNGPGAVPATWYPLPERELGAEVGGYPLQSDLAIGRASMVWTTPTGTAIVYGAHDGVPHPVRLIGGVRSALRPAFTVVPPLDGAVLSPDGWTLAYQSLDEDRTQVSLVDLRTGTVRSVPVLGPNNRPVALNDLVFSSDSAWLAWVGNEAGQETDGRPVPGDARQKAVGAMRVDGTSPTALWEFRTPLQAPALWVSTTGVPGALTENEIWAFEHAGRTESRPLPRPVDFTSAVLAPDGQVLVGLFTVTDEGVMGGTARVDPRPARPTVTLDPATGWQERCPSRVLGVLRGDPIVLEHDEPSPEQPVQVRLTGPDGAPRTVVHGELNTSVRVSVATDLLAEPTHEFGAPDWPADLPWGLVIGAGALALAAAGALAWTLRRAWRA